MEIWCIISFTSSYLAVFTSASGCCLWSTGYLIFPEILACFSCAMLGSTVDTRSASVLGAFGRIAHFFYFEVDSDPEVFGLRSHAEWRSVLSRCCSSQSRYASSNLEFGKLLLRGSRGWQCGSSAGTGPCELVSVTARCIDRCGVAIHTHQVVSETTTTIRFEQGCGRVFSHELT